MPYLSGCERRSQVSLVACALTRKKPDPPRQFKVGDRVKVSLRLGHIVDATIRAVIAHEDSLKLQVDYTIRPRWLE